MKTIETKIDIAASSETVWSILIDLPQYAQWNPFITQAQGQCHVGSKLQIHISPPNSKAMRFKPTVKTCASNRELRWLGHFVLPGLFDGEHCFILEPTDNGCQLVHKEIFSGVLVPLLWNNMKDNTRAGFELMNAALKQRAESASA